MTAPESLLAPAAPAPASLSRFIGRGRELAAVTELLETTRILTLTGAGGSGKTRLAAETVGRVSHRWDRVVWVDLAPALEPGHVISRIAAAFGLTERAETAALEGIRQLIGPQAVLLVLDNCEHQIDTVAVAAERLLMDVPALAILATSREALGVQGETAWLVPPLAPDEASALFLDRAAAVLPSFKTATPAQAAPIAEICRRLDGIPLAIELAAARVRVLSVEQIADRLRDALSLLAAGSRTAVPRHRTLRAAIEWSVSLLAPAEQVLLRRLAVFPATFTLEAAEAVVSDDLLEPADVLDAIAALVDKSLLVLEANATDARYRMLETVRQFAAERMHSALEHGRLARRHAEHFLQAAEVAAPLIYGGANPGIQSAMVADSPNYRAAMEWAAGDPEHTEMGLRLVWALHWFWWSRGPYEEVHEFRRLLPDLEHAEEFPVGVRVRALTAFCMMGCWQGWREEAVLLGDAAIRLLRPDDDAELTAMVLTMAAAARCLTNDFDGAQVLLARAIPLGRDQTRTFIGGIALHFRAACRLAAGDVDGAWADQEEQQVILRRHSQDHSTCHARGAQAAIRYNQGRFDEAEAIFRETLASAQAAPDHWGIVKGIEGVAECLSRSEPERAARLLGAAEAHRERIAHPRWPDEVGRYEEAVARLQQALGPGFAAIWAAGRLVDIGEAAADALRPSAPAATASAAGVAAPDLEVRALGPLEVHRRGEPIDPSAWGSARPRELLVFLLCHPGGATKEQVGAALWPDASPTQLRNNFHVTLHRLRKTLENPEWIRSVGDSYRTDPALTVEFDAAAFERQVRAGLGALKRKDPSAGPILAAALERYRGPFLAQEPAGDWAVEHREHLARICVDGGIGYGRWLLDAGRSEEAAAALRTVTARDPLAEDAWALLMTALARSGDRVQALRAAQQFEAILAADLETEPGPATMALRDRIERGDPV